MTDLPPMTWMLNSTLVLWKQIGLDGSGRATYSASPIEVDCRWDDSDLVLVMENGEQYAAKTELMLDRRVNVGDLVWHGKIENLADVNDPFNNSGVHKVVRSMVTPDIEGEEALYEAIL